MKNNPLVSILIPTYNRANFLANAIDSALDQTYQNIEIIVHDDASTDATPKLLTKYKNSSRIRIIRTEKNHGMIGGWNYIVKQAQGKYIKFLASDDLLDPNCIEELVRAAVAHPSAAIVTCRRKFVDDKGQTIKTMGFDNRSLTVDGREHAHWILTSLRENKIGEPTATLYPATLIKKAGVYDPAFSQFADFEYWVRLLEWGELVYVDKSLCAFRQHAGSNTTAAILDGRFITEIFALIKKYYESPTYSKVFSLTEKDREKVVKTKALDTLKNIKDLVLQGKLLQAKNYVLRLTGAHLLK